MHRKHKRPNAIIPKENGIYEFIKCEDWVFLHPPMSSLVSLEKPTISSPTQLLD